MVPLVGLLQLSVLTEYSAPDVIKTAQYQQDSAPDVI